MQVSGLGIDLAVKCFLSFMALIIAGHNCIAPAPAQKRIAAISGAVVALFNWYGSLCISSSLRSSFDAVRR